MIYFFNNYDSFDAEKNIDLLPKNRKEKFTRIKPKRDKENCAAAFFLLKYALGELGINDFEMLVGDNGKPFLESGEAAFNISHCKNGVAVAVDDNQIGIDVQEITCCNNSVIKKVFTAEEIDFIHSSENLDFAFTTIWTLKESIIKNEGKTIADLKNFSFENFSNYFERYGKHFSIFKIDNTVLSICSEKYFDNVKIINVLI